MPNMPKTLQTLIIEQVEPELDGGRYPVKRIVGETMEVSADIFKEGHDIIGAVLRHKKHGEKAWSLPCTMLTMIDGPGSSYCQKTHSTSTPLVRI